MQTHPHHERPCGWNALLPARSPRPRAEGTIHCAYAVVGAGFTGLAAARRWALARPGDDVRVLDADLVGEGSPGRNSGFMLEIALAEDADAGSLARMEEVNALSRRAMGELAGLVAEHGIDCGLAHRGTYRAAAGPRGAQAIEAYRRFLEGAGLRHERLDAEALAARLGTRHYRVGLHSPDCWLVQPAALIRGLADVLPENVRVHERSAVRALERDGSEWILRTDAATVRAPRVLLANNGWAAALHPGAGALTPVFTYAALTEPVDPGVLGSDPEWGLLPAAKLGCTLRRTADQRLLIRSRYSYRAEVSNESIEAQLRGSLARRWPVLAAVAFAHVWGGSTGVTLGGGPLLAELEPGLRVAAGCNGGGVVKGTLFGDVAARAALGEAVPDLPALFGRPGRVPGEPLRRIGFGLFTELWRRQAGAEA
jgi:glycine/D-amino acid oxidase-like deaminating enzyme